MNHYHFITETLLGHPNANKQYVMRYVWFIENFKKTWNREEFRNSESYSNYLNSRLGGNNGRAKSIVFKNKTYGCIKDAIEDTGVSRYLILKEIEGNNNDS